MRISLRRSFSAPPEVYELEWPSLVQMFQAHAQVRMGGGPTPAREKPPDLPLLAPYAADQLDAKGQGFRQGNVSPEGLWLACLDYDDVPGEAFSETLAMAKAFSARGMCHATWKHGLGPVGTCRMRIVMPLAAPIAPRAWLGAWYRIDTELGGRADTQCKDFNRTYYLPVTNINAPEWAQPCWLEVWGT